MSCESFRMYLMRCCCLVRTSSMRVGPLAPSRSPAGGRGAPPDHPARDARCNETSAVHASMLTNGCSEKTQGSQELLGMRFQCLECYQHPFRVQGRESLAGGGGGRVAPACGCGAHSPTWFFPQQDAEKDD